MSQFHFERESSPAQAEDRFFRIRDAGEGFPKDGALTSGCGRVGQPALPGARLVRAHAAARRDTVAGRHRGTGIGRAIAQAAACLCCETGKPINLNR